MFYLAIAILYGIIGTGGLVWFLLERNSYPIKARAWQFTGITISFGILQFILLAIELHYSVYLKMNISCDIVIWSSVQFMTLWAAPYFYRSYHLMFQFNHQNEKEEGKVGWYHKKKFFFSMPFKLFICCLVSFISFLAGLVIYFAGNKPDPFISTNNCFANYVPLVAIQAVVLFVLLVVLVIKLWKVEDSFFLKKELKIGLFVCVPFFIFWAFSIMTDVLPESFEASWIVMFIIIFGFLISIVYPLVIRYRNRQRMKRTVSMITFNNMGSNQFQKCIMNDELFNDFKERCKKAWCIEAACFCRACLEFSSHFPLMTHSEAVKMAQEIYEKYLKSDSLLEVNLEMYIKKGLVEKILAGQVSLEIFDSAYKSVYTTLRYGVFRDWTLDPAFATTYHRVTGLTDTKDGTSAGRTSRVVTEYEK